MGLPPIRRYGEPFELTERPVGSAERLMTALMGIQQRKEEKARQAELDAIAAEERDRRRKAEEDARTMKLLEFQARLRAQMPQAKEKVEAPVELPAPPKPMPEQAIPEEPTAAGSAEEIQRAAESALPVNLPTGEERAIPSAPLTARLSGGEEIVMPAPSRDEVIAQQQEEFKRKLAQEGELAGAKRSMVPAYGKLAEALGIPEGEMIPEDVMQSAVGRLLAPQDPFAGIQPVTGGYLETTPDGKPKFVRTAVESNRPGVFKSRLDKATGELVLATDEMVAQNPERYGPAPTGRGAGGGGTPLLAGEIQRVTETRQGLAGVAALHKEISGAGKTGLIAKAESLLPAAIVSATGGFGRDTKKRLAVIMLVKQIIGKGLEGGVLRKEDEYKYEAILPTIGDDQDVVLGKLKMLGDRLKSNAEVHLETLEARGRDVSKQRELYNQDVAMLDQSLNPAGNIAQPKSKAEYDALPPGTPYIA